MSGWAADDDRDREGEETSGLEEAAAFGKSMDRVGHVLERVGVNHQVEAIVRIRQAMHVHIGI